MGALRQKEFRMVDIFTQQIEGLGRSMEAHQLSIATKLREDLMQLVSGFTGFDDSNYTAEPYQLLLERLEYFEETTPVMSFIPVLYGMIARTALMAGELQKAIMYALAGKDACNHFEDPKGVRINDAVLCDIALTSRAYLHAAQYFKAAYPEKSAPFMTKESTEYDSWFDSLIKTSNRPATYKLIFETELMRKESAIRFTMVQLKVSRKTAIKYIQ